ncbi:radical SAM protein [Tissierella carlieri]|uniref:Radical SAM protein n=1 Tax=Tissierella carlieri TaxID=689904 RepID=A0ABT1SH46_9FIRM|nr:radical SAM protein [Tissierella carlieri]MCQ4925809.1 radical SAM protein [Tissierella carlieri]
MKIIDNCVCTYSTTLDSYIIINTINGLIDQIDFEEKEIFHKWYLSDDIEPNNEYEKSFFDSLLERGYITDNKHKEETVKMDVIKQILKNWEASPYSIGIVPTYECNFRCSYCYENHLLHENMDVITEKQIDIIKASYKNIRDISIYGGEPLLPRTKNIIPYILKQFDNYPITIITNGYYLDEFVEMFDNKENVSFQITLDGDREYHDRIRHRICGGSTFDKIVDNIDIMLQKNHRIHIRMNICKENLEYVQALISFFESKFSKFKDAIAFNFDVITQIKEIDKEYIFIWLKDNYKALSKVFRINANFNRCNIFMALGERKPVELRTNYCNSETTSRVFDPYGKVYSCMMTVGRDEEAIGYYSNSGGISINKESDILNRSILSIEECKDCKLSLLCGGGCAYEKYEVNKTVHAPNCDYIKRILEKVI